MLSFPLVSAIITTRNEEKHIGTLLHSLKNQSYSNIEIVLVDNGSTDQTVTIASNFTVHIYQKGPERSAQRNFGVKQAQGDFVLILDADMSLTPTVIAECVAVCQTQPQLGGVIIPEMSYGEGFWAKCKALERNCYVGDESIEAARFFKREIYLSTGGYDESLHAAEDWDLSDRVRKLHPIGRIQSFILHNEGSLSLKTLIRKKRYYARAGSTYLKKQPVQPTLTKVLYFLRPALYRHWRQLVSQPVLFFGMSVMLALELVAAGVGYIEGIIILRPQNRLRQ